MPWQLDVVDVLAHAADEARVLLAEHPAVADGVLVVVGVLEVLGRGGDASSLQPRVHGGHDSLPDGLGGLVAVRPSRARPPTAPSGRSWCSRCTGRSGPRWPRGWCRSLGSGSRSSRARAVISIPGVQKPHCRPWQRMKPSWTGSSTPSCSRPSTVRTSRPPAIAASTVQVFTGSPSIQADAGAAVAGVAAPVGAGEPELVAEEVDEQHPPSISRVTVSPLTVIVTCMSAVPSCLVAGDAGSDALDGRAQRPPRQLVGEVPLVLRGAAVVGGRASSPRPRSRRPGRRARPRAAARAAPRRSPGCRWCSDRPPRARPARR